MAVALVISRGGRRSSRFSGFESSSCAWSMAVELDDGRKFPWLNQVVDAYRFERSNAVSTDGRSS